MSKTLTNKQMSERITRYYLSHRNILKSFMKVGNMPLTQYHILSLLSENTNMRMGEISQKMAISRPNLTPLVDKLVALGFVQRISDDNARRVTYVSITEKGRNALDDERRLISESVAKFTETLTEDERSRLADALDTITEITARLQQ